MHAVQVILGSYKTFLGSFEEMLHSKLAAFFCFCARSSPHSKMGLTGQQLNRPCIGPRKCLWNVKLLLCMCWAPITEAGKKLLINSSEVSEFSQILSYRSLSYTPHYLCCPSPYFFSSTRSFLKRRRPGLHTVFKVWAYQRLAQWYNVRFCFRVPIPVHYSKAPICLSVKETKCVKDSG